MKIAGSPARVFLLAAWCYQHTGQKDQAVSAYEQAIRKDSALADSELETILQSARSDARSSDPASDDAPRSDSRIRVPVENWVIAPTADIERSKISFKDVGGMDRLKDEIRMKIIHPLQQPELYRAYGKAIGGGILMYGPPGCGKTHLARATAGEVDAYFLSIGIHDVLNMYLGESESKLHTLFELARRNAPCVLFIDEVDAVGASRTDMRQSAGRHLINQLLAEMDGIDASNDGILILAASNAPWHMDSALRRPGRFDRVIFVPPPDRPARAAILEVMLREKPVDKIDFDQIARSTDGFSGADLKAVLDGAIEGKLREAIKTGKPVPITTRDLLRAAGDVKPSTKDWFATARNYALYSNESGTYDDVLAYLKLDPDSGLFSKLPFRRNE
jgi:SpoVK/Ycf46/Vps4 family AAA+-type ATPase